MNKEKEVFDYDEDDSVKFIQNHLPEEMKNKISNDDISYIVDLIYEFYEKNGFLEEDENESVEINEDELIIFAIENARKDNIRKFSDDEIEAIVSGELAYCDSLNLFD
jgi:hypothetical protein